MKFVTSCFCCLISLLQKLPFIVIISKPKNYKDACLVSNLKQSYISCFHIGERGSNSRNGKKLIFFIFEIELKIQTFLKEMWDPHKRNGKKKFPNIKNRKFKNEITIKRDLRFQKDKRGEDHKYRSYIKYLYDP